MLNEKILSGQLQAMGITSEDTVLIHTSMRAVGAVENGADGLIDAFRSYLTHGLFIVPTHTWASVSAKQPIFDSRSEKPCIGILPECAVTHPGGVRSLNPTHSMVAFGTDAEAYIGGEEKVRTPMPGNGCWGRLADRNAKILLIGVGLERNTFIHSIDEMAGTPNRLSDEEVSFTDIDRFGNEIPHPMRVVFARGIDDVSAFFPKFAPLLQRENAITFGTVGNAPTVVCDAKRTKEVLIPLFERAKDAGVELCCDMTPPEQLL